MSSAWGMYALCGAHEHSIVQGTGGPVLAAFLLGAGELA